MACRVSTSAVFRLLRGVLVLGALSSAFGVMARGGSPAALPAVNLESVNVDPHMVLGGGSSTGTVTLNEVAPTGGTVIALSSDNSAATVPASVTVAAGATSAAFTVSTTSVGVDTVAAIDATLGNRTKRARLEINALKVKSLRLSPENVSAGGTSTATVTLNDAAPSGGSTVNLSTESTAVTIPSTVVVAAGQNSATFNVVTTAVVDRTKAKIKANLGNENETAELTIEPVVSLSSVSLDPSSVGGGASTTGVVALSGPAPDGGISINLSSSQNAAQVQTSVKVPQGRKMGTFAISTTSVTAITTVTITATLGTVSQTATLTINPLALASLTVHPREIHDGNTATGVVELNSPAGAGGVVVTLSSDNPVATIPATVTIAAGHSSGSFAIGTSSVTTQTTVTLTATVGSTSKTTTLTISPATLESLRLEPDRVTGGSTVTGTIKLSGPAPTGGLIITLTSNSSSATVPAMVTVPAGQNAITFTVATHAVTAKEIAQVTATLGTMARTENLTITQ